MGASSLDVWKAVESGGGQREIVAMNSRDNPTLGVSIGQELQRQLDIEEGDVVFVEADDDEGCLKIHFAPEDTEGR